MTAQHILIVDDEPDIRNLISEILIDEGYKVTTADSGNSALAVLNEISPDLILLDIWMPDLDGISLLKSWNESNALDFSVVMMSGHGTIETAIEATKMGAKDFIEKPISMAKLLQTIEQVLAQHVPAKNSSDNNDLWNTLDPLGNSEPTRKLRESIEKLTQTRSNTLFFGDSGTGKLTLSLLLHSKRHQNLNSAYVIDSLTLTATNIIKYFNEAVNSLKKHHQSGSIIFTNLDCLTDELQALLLSLVKQSASEIQFLATCQQDLKQMTTSKEFSSDLYHLLAEITVYVPTLSERSDDVPELLNYYINHLPDNEKTPYRKMSFAAQNHLRNHQWTGNIRELKNMVRQLQLLGKEGEIQLDEVVDLIKHSSADSNATSHNTRYDLNLREAREEFERDYLVYHLQNVEGKVGDLAKIVGMERTHLYRKLRALDINPKSIDKS